MAIYQRIERVEAFRLPECGNVGPDFYTWAESAPLPYRFDMGGRLQYRGAGEWMEAPPGAWLLLRDTSGVWQHMSDSDFCTLYRPLGAG